MNERQYIQLLELLRDLNHVTLDATYKPEHKLDRLFICFWLVSLAFAVAWWLV